MALTIPSSDTLILLGISFALIFFAGIIVIILITCLCLSNIKTAIPLLSPIKSLIIVWFIISIISILFSFSEAYVSIIRLAFEKEIPPQVLEWFCRIFIGGYFGFGWVGWSSTLTFMTWQKYRLDNQFKIVSKINIYLSLICKVFFIVFFFTLIHTIIITLNLYIPRLPVEFLWLPVKKIRDRGNPFAETLKCQLPTLNLVIHFIYIAGFLLIFNISHVRSQRRLINLKMKRRILRLQTIVTIATVLAVFVHVLELVFGFFEWHWVDFAMLYSSLIIDMILYLIICIGYILIPAWESIKLSNLLESNSPKTKKRKLINRRKSKVKIPEVSNTIKSEEKSSEDENPNQIQDKDAIGLISLDSQETHKVVQSTQVNESSPLVRHQSISNQFEIPKDRLKRNNSLQLAYGTLEGKNSKDSIDIRNSIDQSEASIKLTDIEIDLRSSFSSEKNTLLNKDSENNLISQEDDAPLRLNPRLSQSSKLNKFVEDESDDDWSDD